MNYGRDPSSLTYIIFYGEQPEIMKQPWNQLERAVTH